MKYQNIEERIEALRKEEARLQAFQQIINDAINNLRWCYMEIMRDEDGNEVLDDNGDRIWIEPDEDSCYYEDFIARRDAITEIEQLAGGGRNAQTGVCGKAVLPALTRQNQRRYEHDNTGSHNWRDPVRYCEGRREVR